MSQKNVKPLLTVKYDPTKKIWLMKPLHLPRLMAGENMTGMFVATEFRY